MIPSPPVYTQSIRADNSRLAAEFAQEFSQKSTRSGEEFFTGRLGDWKVGQIGFCSIPTYGRHLAIPTRHPRSADNEAETTALVGAENESPSELPVLEDRRIRIEESAKLAKAAKCAKGGSCFLSFLRVPQTPAFQFSLKAPVIREGDQNAREFAGRVQFGSEPK